MVGTNSGNIANINPFRYRGYYFDCESGLYYLMSRYYDPEIGQFISPDMQDYLAPDTIGGVNLYAYCNNNPVMHYAPTGHVALAWAIAGLLILGTIIGGGIGYNIATASSDEEAKTGDLIYGTVLGAVAGFGVVGVAIGLTALAASLIAGGSTAVGGLTLFQIAMQGFAYFNIGSAILQVLRD